MKVSYCSIAVVLLPEAPTAAADSLHLTSYPHTAVIPPANVQWHNANVVSACYYCVSLRVIDDECKHASQIIGEVHATLLIQRDQRLAV
jgi:hypothetical protein